MARRTNIASARGFTLIEVMLVIALAALFTAGATVGFSATQRGRVKAGAAHLASSFRAAYVHALTTGKATRVVLDFNDNQVWIEDTLDAHVLDRRDNLRGGDLEAEAQSEAQRVMESRPRAPRAEFEQVAGNRYRPRVLERGVTIGRLYAQHEPGARENGRGYVYFFSGGVAERAVVQLRGPGDVVYSVVLHPLNGRSEIFAEAVEPPDRDEPEERDDREVDAREMEARPQ